MLVLLLELLLGGMAGKHIASGELGGLDMGETYKSMKKSYCELDQTFLTKCSFTEQEP